MDESGVRIVKLEPMRVASFYGFGEQPEYLAWEKLTAWAKPRGYLNDLKNHRIFGFNNPDPAAGSPNYGYEDWMVIGREVEPEGEMEIKEFSGGLYAVAHCVVRGDPYDAIPTTWHKLVEWLENSPYEHGSHQWLEEHLEVVGLLENEFTLDLYLPIAE